MSMPTVTPPTNRHLTPDEIENNINGLPVTENKLREAFRSVDSAGVGFISFDDMKAYYHAQENFGVEYTDEEIDTKIRKYHLSGTGKINFDEFCCILLSIAQR
eukprot:RCo006075